MSTTSNSTGPSDKCGCESPHQQQQDRSKQYKDYESAMIWAQRNCHGQSLNNPPASEPQGVNWFWVIFILLVIGLGAWYWWVNFGRNYQAPVNNDINTIVSDNQKLAQQIASSSSNTSGAPSPAGVAK